MIKKILPYLPLATLMTVIGIGIGIAQFLIAEVQAREEIKQRIHSDPAKVIETEKHIENVEEDFKKRMEFQMHVDQMTHELLETAKEIKEQRKNDSIIRMRDAVSNYQMKKNVDTLIKFWKDYNAQANEN